jgi:hypothetical protein
MVVFLNRCEGDGCCDSRGSTRLTQVGHFHSSGTTWDVLNFVAHREKYEGDFPLDQGDACLGSIIVILTIIINGDGISGEHHIYLRKA